MKEPHASAQEWSGCCPAPPLMERHFFSSEVRRWYSCQMKEAAVFFREDWILSPRVCTASRSQEETTPHRSVRIRSNTHLHCKGSSWASLGAVACSGHKPQELLSLALIGDNEVRWFGFPSIVKRMLSWVLCNRHTYTLGSMIYCWLLLFLGSFRWNVSLPAHWAANWPTLHI